MNNEIAFITGANGFVGSHLVELLVSKGIEVHCLMRSSSDDKWLKGLDITIHRGGIENESYLHDLFVKHKATYIFHLAGTVKALDYAGYERGNVAPTKIILEAALGVDSIKHILITSSLAASQPTKVCHPVTESDGRNPLTDYGRSKVAEEDLAHSYMDRLPITIVRPPVVIGERDTEVYLFFKTIKMGLLPMIGFENKTLSLVYVKDLVLGFYQAITSDQSIGNTYFIGGYRDEYTWFEIGKTAAKYLKKTPVSLRIPHVIVKIIARIAEVVAKISGQVPSLNRQKAREMVCESWSCSSQRAKNDFNYNPQYDLDSSFEKTISWYKEMKWL